MFNKCTKAGVSIAVLGCLFGFQGVANAQDTSRIDQLERQLAKAQWLFRVTSQAVRTTEISIGQVQAEIRSLHAQYDRTGDLSILQALQEAESHLGELERKLVRSQHMLVQIRGQIDWLRRVLEHLRTSDRSDPGVIAP